MTFLEGLIVAQIASAPNRTEPLSGFALFAVVFGITLCLGGLVLMLLVNCGVAW